jgi:hypothetical protein
LRWFFHTNYFLSINYEFKSSNLLSNILLNITVIFWGHYNKKFHMSLSKRAHVTIVRFADLLFKNTVIIDSRCLPWMWWGQYICVLIGIFVGLNLAKGKTVWLNILPWQMACCVYIYITVSSHVIQLCFVAVLASSHVKTITTIRHSKSWPSIHRELRLIFKD